MVLETYGFRHVGQLLRKDGTMGRIMTRIDTDYPEDMTTNYAELIINPTSTGAEVGKVTLKINSDEALSNESL
jgi:hypothetical protein